MFKNRCAECGRFVWPWQQSARTIRPMHTRCHVEVLIRRVIENKAALLDVRARNTTLTAECDQWSKKYWEAIEVLRLADLHKALYDIDYMSISDAGHDELIELALCALDAFEGQCDEFLDRYGITRY